MSYYDESYPPSLWAPAPPPVVLPTNAIPGTPGSFTPVDSQVPSTVAELNAVTPVPGTAWTDGEYVALTTGEHHYWDGSVWVVGNAPAAEAAEPEPPPEEPPA